MTRFVALLGLLIGACVGASEPRDHVEPRDRTLLGPVTAILPGAGALLCCSQTGVVRIGDDGVDANLASGERIFALARDPGDGTLFGAGGTPAEVGIVVAWRDGTVVARAELSDDLVSALVFDAEDHALVCGCDDGSVLLLDATSLHLRAVLRRHSAPVRALALEGGRLASAGLDGNLMLGPLAAPPRSLRDHAAGIEALAWSTDGRVLASAARDGRVRLFDADGRLLWASDSEPARILALVALGDESHAFISADAEGTLRLVDEAGTRVLKTPDGEPIFALARRDEWVFAGRQGRITSIRCAR